MRERASASDRRSVAGKSPKSGEHFPTKVITALRHRRPSRSAGRDRPAGAGGSRSYAGANSWRLARNDSRGGEHATCSALAWLLGTVPTLAAAGNPDLQGAAVGQEVRPGDVRNSGAGVVGSNGTTARRC